MNIENREVGSGKREAGVGKEKLTFSPFHLFTFSYLHPLIAAGMTLGLALFYRSTSVMIKAFGFALFCALAVLRPNLALAFVPLAVPLYLMPVWLTTLRENLRLPLHEIVLWIAMAAAGVRWLVGGPSAALQRTGKLATLQSLARYYLPHALFLLAGALGVALAVDRGAALREFRWMIVEPMIFYAMLCLALHKRASATNIAQPANNLPRDQLRDESSIRLLPFVNAFVVGGAVVGLLGILQYYGHDFVPTIFFLQKQVFGSSDTVAADGLQRVTSVYGHPNNVGLYLGRVWPLAAALALYAARQSPLANRQSSIVRSVFFTMCAALCIFGIIASFSRGAWFGIGAALAVLTFGWLRVLRVSRQQMTVALVCVAIIAIGLVGWSLSLRSETGAGSASARVLIWRESLKLIRQHPLGLGPDQFYYYHNPFYGRSQIDPSLRGTSEETAAHPHNLLLDIWLSVGPLGLFALGWLIVRFFRQARAALTLLPSLAAALIIGAVAAMVAGLVHGVVDNFYFHVPDLAFAFWLLVALAEDHQ